MWTIMTEIERRGAAVDAPKKLKLCQSTIWKYHSPPSAAKSASTPRSSSRKCARPISLRRSAIPVPNPSRKPNWHARTSSVKQLLPPRQPWRIPSPVPPTKPSSSPKPSTKPYTVLSLPRNTPNSNLVTGHALAGSTASPRPSGPMLGALGAEGASSIMPDTIRRSINH